MRLYYHPLSSNSRRVLLTAYQLGLDLDLVAVDLTGGEHKRPDYLRLNPNGRVPTLVDGAFELWESHAIMQYLADQAPQQEIYPRDMAARADVNRWLFWSAYHFAPAAALIIKERVSKQILGIIAAPLMHAARAQLPIAEFEHLQDWFARVRALEAWVKSER